MDKVQAVAPHQIGGGMAQDALVGRAGVDEFELQVEQTNQVAGVFGDQPVLFLAAGKGRRDGQLFPLGLFLRDRVAERRRQPPEAGLENVVIRSFLHAFDRHFLGMRAGHQNERHFGLAFLEQPQCVQRGELGQGIIRQNNVRLELDQVADEFLLCLHPPGHEIDLGFDQLAFDQLGVRRGVFEQQNVQLLLHQDPRRLTRTGGKPRRARAGAPRRAARISRPPAPIIHVQFPGHRWAERPLLGGNSARNTTPGEWAPEALESTDKIYRQTLSKTRSNQGSPAVVGLMKMKWFGFGWSISGDSRRRRACDSSARAAKRQRSSSPAFGSPEEWGSFFRHGRSELAC